MKFLRRIQFEHQPYKIWFSNDGSRLWIVSRFAFNAFVKPEIVQINLRDLSEVWVKPEIGPIVDSAFLNSEVIVAATVSVNGEHQLVLYDISKKAVLLSVETGYIMSICIDHKRKRIITGTVTDGNNDYVTIYNYSLQPQKEFRVGEMPIEMALSQSGDKLAIAGVYFNIWNIAVNPVRLSQDYLRRAGCTGQLGEASSIDITPDGRYAISGFVESKYLAAVMDAESGEMLGCFGNFGNRFHVVSGVAISPDGKYIAVAGAEPDIVAIYRVSDGAQIYKYTGKSCNAIAFSPRWNILAVGDENSVLLWHHSLSELRE